MWNRNAIAKYDRLDPADERWVSLPVTDTGRAVAEINRYRHAQAQMEYARLYTRIKNQVRRELRQLEHKENQKTK